jgi:hypothetical protein
MKKIKDLIEKFKEEKKDKHGRVDFKKLKKSADKKLKALDTQKVIKK